jgi:hypothetical protein
MYKKIIVAALVFASVSYSQMRNIEGLGSIDWAKKEITVSGSAVFNPAAPTAAVKPMAIRVARQKAIGNMLELLKNIRITPDLTVEMRLTESERAKGFLNDYIERTAASSKSFEKSKSVEIQLICAIENIWPEVKSDSVISDTLVEEVDQLMEYTGLVLDVGGNQFEPSLVPDIVNETGEKIFGIENFEKATLFKNSGIRYSNTPENAGLLTDVLGVQPLYVRAKNTTGKPKGILIVSNEDAQKIKALNRKIEMFKNGSIVVVFNKS